MKRLFLLLSRFDWLLAGAAFILVAFGVSAIYSVALSTEQGDFGNLEKQLIALVIGIVLLLVFATSNYKLFRNWTLILYGVGNTLLLGVLIFGHAIRGTTGWYVFSVSQHTLFSFQPVEFMKIVLILTLAKYFSEKARRSFGWRELLVSGLLTLIPSIFIMLQPDFGSALLLFGTWGIMSFFAGLKWRHALVMGALGFFSSLFAWFVLFAEYQKERILIFLDPSRDPLGRGYNVAQAIIAVGSGKVFGRGLGFGSQSQLKFLPESQTDFIFAVIAEELGFVGVLFILIAFGLIFFRLIKLIKLCHDNYTTYLLIGVGSVFFLQFFVNIGMNLGLLPVTGIGLPLVSYGGSSLLMSLSLIGLVQSIAIRTSSPSA